MNIKLEIEKEKKELIQIRRELHKIPEPGFKEIQTSSFIIKKLEDYGIRNIKRSASTGIYFTLQGKNNNKTIMIRNVVDICRN